MRPPKRTASILVACGAVLCAFADTAHALYDRDPQFVVRGFGTLGAVYNPSDKFELVRDLSQPEGARDGWNARPDSVIGIQLNARPAPDWEVVIQGVSRYSYDDDARPRLSWGFLKYSPNEHLDIRAGRVGYDAYLDGDSRSVGYSFLPVRRPIEYYGTLELSHIDGGDITVRYPLGAGVGIVKLFAGQANEKLVFGDGTASYDLKGSLVVGGSAAYEVGAWRVRIGGSEARLDEELEGLDTLKSFLRASGQTSVADGLGLKDAHISNVNVGVAYDGAHFGAVMQYTERFTDTLAAAEGHNGYALFSYGIGRWTPYLAFAISDSDADDTGLSPGHPLYTAVEAVAQGGVFDQRSYSIGLRRDIRTWAALKLQLEQVEARNNAVSFYRNSDPGWDGDATVFSFSVDFIF